MDDISVDEWGTFITTPKLSAASATVSVTTAVQNRSGNKQVIAVTTLLYNMAGTVVAQKTTTGIAVDTLAGIAQELTVLQPRLWSNATPYLYKAKTIIHSNGKVTDEYETPFGIRSFSFDATKGFFLNGQHLQIRGVCLHHDLGCLGTAVNKRALQRQLEILKAMGCNGIRTSHNPPAPELLTLCDEMGFIVMDEAFDMWKSGKTAFDYHLYWDQWHRKDLEDQVRRDRNHPSVFIWSIGNEIPEQWAKEDDNAPRERLGELHSIVRSLDTTRPTVTANNEVNPWNKLLQANMTELIGYNYNDSLWSRDSVVKRWGNKPFIVTESVSALETRGHYDVHIPSDSLRRWPERWDKPCVGCNTDLTVSAYDHVSAPWGSTHEETMKVFNKNANVSGHFIWTGFDYIGEPTPYPWPARSSYFGIVDLAGFPKDVYYMYQGEWTSKPVLHLLPHWNWQPGQTIDVWAYYSQADAVELFLNGRSLGVQQKKGDDLHVVWRVPFEAGTLKAVSRKNGKVVLTKTVQTAGAPARIVLTADRNTIGADGNDLSFITATVTDAAGIMVPDAANLLQFEVKGNALLAGTDNGLQTSLESFKGSSHKAFNGLCLAVMQAGNTKGVATVTARAVGLQAATVVIQMK
jgi:beta-galactosidase